MFLLFILFLIVLLHSLEFSKTHDYLSKTNTSAIKGVFVVLVFLNHVKTYLDFDNSLDLFAINSMYFIGQYMVVMFLFYSGYGIYESIKIKGNTYIDSFFSRRIVSTFLDLGIALILYIALNTVLGIHYSIGRTLLAFTGWTSIGNSNWYMFAIFVLYFFTLASFKLFNKNHKYSISLITVLSLIYIVIMPYFKNEYFSNTILAYALGMWYSYYKDQINNYIFKFKSNYTKVFCITTVLFIITSIFRQESILMHNIASCIFGIFIILLSMRVVINSKIFLWCGNHLFWLYILQRIPMIALSKIYPGMDNNLFIIISLVVTVLLSFYVNKISIKLKQLIQNN